MQDDIPQNTRVATKLSLIGAVKHRRSAQRRHIQRRNILHHLLSTSSIQAKQTLVASTNS